MHTPAGKREASIQGAGVGGTTAAKLLARYGSLEAVLTAAQAGQLKGWGPAVARLLQGGTGSGSSGGGGGSSDGSSSGGGGGRAPDEVAWERRQAQLRRNRRLFAANGDPAVVEPRGWGKLLAALDQLQPAALGTWDCAGSSAGNAAPGRSIVPAGAELAWQHPLHARRWRQLQQLLGGAAPSLTTTPQGLAVDEFCSSVDGNGSGSGGSGSGCAIFHVCPCDVQAGSWPAAVAATGDCAPGSDCAAALMPALHGAMRHHVKLVQRSGYRVQLKLAATEPLPAGLLAD